MDEVLPMFEKLAEDIRGLSVHWRQIPKDYAAREDYCKGRADGLLEAAIALRQVVKNAERTHLQPGAVKALVEACNEVIDLLDWLLPHKPTRDFGGKRIGAVGDKLESALAPFKDAQEVKPDVVSG